MTTVLCVRNIVSRLNRCTISSLHRSKYTSTHTRTRVAYCTATSSLESQPIPEPYTSEDDRQYPQKIQDIVTEISQLTLLEVADLNVLLKKRLKIKDAPVMSMGAMPSAAPSEDDEGALLKKEKSVFTVKLMKFDDSKKVQLIKLVKSLVEGMNLVQSKKFVESAPQVVKSELPKDEAEKLKASLEEVGGVVEME